MNAVKRKKVVPSTATVTLTKKAAELLHSYKEATLEYAFKGSFSPEHAEQVESDFDEAETALMRFIESLESSR